MSIKTLAMSIKTLAGIELPGYMSKRRLIANYFGLTAKTAFGSFRGGLKYRTFPFQSSYLPPGVWGQFTKGLEAYYEHVAAHYILDSFIVRRTMLPASSNDMARFSKYRHIIADYFLGTEVPDRIQCVLEHVPTMFKGVDRQMLELWLWSYFYPFYLFRDRISRDAVLDSIPVELGAGLGVFNLAIGGACSKRQTAIFDLPAVLHLQNIVSELLTEQGFCVPTTDRVSNLPDLVVKTAGQRYSVMSYWAFTEFPLELRDQAVSLLQKSEFCLFASNPVFQGVDNRHYFEALVAQMPGKKVHYAPIDWSPYSEHTYVLIK